MNITPKEQRQGIVWETLNKVVDPELGIGIVDIGLIYQIQKTNSKLRVILTMTSPSCPSSDQIIADVKDKLLELDGVEEVETELVWKPAWRPEYMDEEVRMMFLGL